MGNIEWRKLHFLKGDYSISNYGVLVNNRTGHKLKPHNHKGYVRYSVNNATWFAHRLVAFGFIDNPNNYKHINHMDYDKKNNHVSNLEWCTPQENSLHHVKNPSRTSLKGKYSGSYDIKAVRMEKDGEVLEFISLKKAGLYFNVDSSPIARAGKFNKTYKQWKVTLLQPKQTKPETITYTEKKNLLELINKYYPEHIGLFE